MSPNPKPKPFYCGMTHYGLLMMAPISSLMLITLAMT